MFERTKKSPWKLLENVPQKSLKSPWKRYVMICGNHGDIFDFSSETTKRNCRKLDRKQDLNVLYQVCVFRADRKNKMAALASHWLRHFRLLLWNHWKKFYETWQEARSQRPLSSLCFSGRSEKQDGRPGLWLAETFSTSILKPLNGIQRNLTGSKISTSSIKFVFFGPIGRTRWPLWPLIGWDIFDFSSETAEQNSTKLDRKQDLNVLYQFWFFSGRSKKQDGRSGLWLAEIFSTSPLKPLNGIQRNLTGSKISTSSIKFVFFGPIGKTRWPPWPLIGWDIFYFSSETTEKNSTKLDRKQDLNVLYQVCVFRADQKNKMAALASDWLRHFRLLLWNRWTEFNETWQEARSQHPLSSLCFSGRSEKQDGRPDLWLAETRVPTVLEKSLNFGFSLKSPWKWICPWKVLEFRRPSLKFQLVVLDFLFCIFWTESLNGHSKWRGTRANFPQKKIQLASLAAAYSFQFLLLIYNSRTIVIISFLSQEYLQVFMYIMCFNVSICFKMGSLYSYCDIITS